MGTSPRRQGDAPEWADANCRAVFEAAPDAMLVVNRKGEIVAANQEATKLYGYSREHLIGRMVESLIPARLRDRHRQHRENFFAIPEMQTMQVIEIFAVRSDASEIPVDVSLRLLTIGTETFAISAIRDATERRRIEGLKASAERRGRLVQNSSVAMVVTHGLEHKVELLNDKFTALLGYTIDDIPDVAHWWPLAYPDEAYRQAVRSEWETRTEKTLRDGTPFAPMEVTVRCKDGSTRHLEVHLSTMAGDTNLVTFIDLTERKLAEDAIKESEARYRRIVEITNEGVWLLDSNLHTRYVNRQMAEMLGYEPGEMVGRSVFDFYFPGDVERKKQVLRGRQQGRREQLDERVRRKDGSELWVRMAATPVLKDNAEFDGALAMMSDITERKLSEERLRESEERFRLVANTAPVMIWMSGPDKKPTYFNQPWLDFTGLSETDLLNGLAGIVHPEDYLQCHDVYCRGFDQRQPFRKECRLRRHDGQYRWMLDIGVPRFHKDGSFAGYIGSCVDVTEHKLAEDVLANMTRKLVEAQEQERARIARELHDDISQRLAMLAIEIDQVQEHAETASEVRDRVHELSNRTKDISSDVQALSHELHSSKLEYLGIVGGMKSWCSEFGEKQGMEIEFKSSGLPNSLPPEISICLFRVLQEALHNAAKHSGVERVDVQLREEACEIHLIVSDLGKGFDVASAMRDRGLGVTSMQERVRLVGGTIVVDSKPLGGTTIHVRVPLGAEHDSQRVAG
jgi:PAS domain S-box-containing protein